MLLACIVVGGCGNKPGVSEPAPAPYPPISQPTPLPYVPPSQPAPPPVEVVPPAAVSPVWISQISTQVVGGVRVRFEVTPRAEDSAARVFWTTSDILTPNSYFAGLDAAGNIVTLDRRHKAVDSGFMDEYRAVLLKVAKWQIIQR